MSHLGKIVKDAWLFDILPEDEACEGWTAAQMQNLYERVYAAWEPYAHLPSRLSPELMEKYQRIYLASLERAKDRGWDPELGEDD